jgi:hypothetical protein
MLEYDEYWISKINQIDFVYDSGNCNDYTVTFGFVEDGGEHDAVYIRLYECFPSWGGGNEYMFQGGYWIEDGWTENLWVKLPDDMIKQIELLAARYYKLKAFA